MIENTIPVACEYVDNPDIEHEAIKFIKTWEKHKIIPIFAYLIQF